MTYIHWDKPFFVDPSTGEVVPSGTEGAVGLPTYANYGGGDYSSGEFGGQLLTKSSGKPLSQEKLTELGSDSQDPLDLLDYLFYRHDVASSDVGEAYTQEQAKADARLVKSLIKLDASYDPEASLYAAGATFTMLGRLALHDQIDLLPPKVLVAATQDAVSDIQHALENLPQQELVVALGSLFEPTSELGVFEFKFDITTTSPEQEVIERTVVNALNVFLDSGEPEDVPVDTGFPVPGVSEYRLTFNLFTHDLDFLSG
ncbi:hypothetical protein AA309_24015 [Microvirga vignae]|uniref:Uncharacterized protein n=2 Tax=Microvirga vignae TaxID=1225564 RepID=A0A0H1R6H2_9HYPH|nr:hypothetical protein AA309_24015 [Microvirga vignae]